MSARHGLCQPDGTSAHRNDETLALEKRIGELIVRSFAGGVEGFLGQGPACTEQFQVQLVVVMAEADVEKHVAVLSRQHLAGLGGVEGAAQAVTVDHRGADPSMARLLPP